MSFKTLFEQQQLAESVAMQLLGSSELTRQKETVFRQLSAEPVYQSAAGRQTLDIAVQELTNAAALFAANSDPARPLLAWMFSAPIALGGHDISGKRWAGDNPDNLYRFFPIDGDSSYELVVRPGKALPAQFSFVIWDTFMGESTKQVTKGENKLLDIVIDALLDRTVKADADGSFKITIDSSPANGRNNHLRSTADAKVVLVRDSFSDWGAQDPLQIEIKRIGGPQTQAPDMAELAQRAAYILDGVIPVLRWWLNNTEGFATAHPNTMGKPYLRGGGWGFSSSGQFKLAKDEALVVTAYPLGAKYLSAVVWDPWTVSREHIRRTASLNNTQAEANADGSYTYVASATDPGVRNWVDTDGLQEGFFFLRWQSLPDGLASADGAVRSIQVVKLAGLASRLPAAMSRFTAEMRAAQRAERARTIAHRYGFARA